MIGIASILIILGAILGLALIGGLIFLIIFLTKKDKKKNISANSSQANNKQ